MATLTAGAAAAIAPAKAIHAGVNSVVGEYDLAASLSAGDVVQMVKVPAGARIVDGHLNINCTGSALTISVGDGSDVDRYIASQSASADGVIRFNTAAMEYSYSAADTIDVTISAESSATATGSIKLTVQYMMDQ